MKPSYRPYWKPRHRMFIVPVIAMILLASALVQWLWNLLLPHLLQAPRIRYGEAIGLLILSRILFGGFHFRKPSTGSHRSGFREKFMNMSEEEKQHFREQWRNKCRPNKDDSSN
ncbi:MAG: hypothetical protein KDC57_11240 [Saprospiraceae bacterium]|nr:hypothetical protein [Saprospiraceae bacterium]